MGGISAFVSNRALTGTSQFDAALPRGQSGMNGASPQGNRRSAHYKRGRDAPIGTPTASWPSRNSFGLYMWACRRTTCAYTTHPAPAGPPVCTQPTAVGISARAAQMPGPPRKPRNGHNGPCSAVPMCSSGWGLRPEAAVRVTVGKRQNTAHQA